MTEAPPRGGPIGIIGDLADVDLVLVRSTTMFSPWRTCCKRQQSPCRCYDGVDVETVCVAINQAIGSYRRT